MSSEEASFKGHGVVVHLFPASYTVHTLVHLRSENVAKGNSGEDLFVTFFCQNLLLLLICSFYCNTVNT